MNGKPPSCRNWRLECHLLAKPSWVRILHPYGLLAGDGVFSKTHLRKRGLFAYISSGQTFTEIYVPFDAPSCACWRDRLGASVVNVKAASPNAKVRSAHVTDGAWDESGRM